MHYIEFFKNKAVEDWSLLGTLSNLGCVYWFHNQRITKLWDMSENYALKAIKLNDFTRLHDLSGIERAPALEWFGFGDAIWSTSEIESLKPFIGTKIRRIDFSGKKIRDMDISFIPDMKGYSLKPYIDSVLWNNQTNKQDIPAAIIVGKRKPMLAVAGNEKKISNYVAKFEKLVEQYQQE